MKTSKDYRQEFGKVLVRGGAVKSPAQALLVLLNGWPAKHTANYQHAVHACRIAIDGRITPNKARDAFERAAKEAGLLT